MSEPLLNVKNLSVDVEEKSILHGINLTINKGETHVLMGPNGAGKSTLGCTLMGNPNYHVTDGEIFFGGENIQRGSRPSAPASVCFSPSRTRLRFRESPSPTLSAAPSPRGPERTSVSGISIKNSRKPWRFSTWIRPTASVI